MEAGDRQAHTDRRQWAVMEADGAVGDRHRPEEDGEDEAEEEAEEDAEAVTLGIGLARTRDRGAGVRAEACRDHHTAGRLHGHRLAGGAVEVATAGETRRQEEEEGAVAVDGGAPVTIRTTVHGRGAGAESAGSTRTGLVLDATVL